MAAFFWPLAAVALTRVLTWPSVSAACVAALFDPVFWFTAMVVLLGSGPALHGSVRRMMRPRTVVVCHEGNRWRLSGTSLTAVRRNGDMPRLELHGRQLVCQRSVRRRRMPTQSDGAAVTSAAASCEAIENGDDVYGNPGTVALLTPCFPKYPDGFELPDGVQSGLL